MSERWSVSSVDRPRPSCFDERRAADITGHSYRKHFAVAAGSAWNTWAKNELAPECSSIHIKHKSVKLFWRSEWLWSSGPKLRAFH